MVFITCRMFLIGLFMVFIMFFTVSINFGIEFIGFYVISVISVLFYEKDKITVHVVVAAVAVAVGGGAAHCNGTSVMWLNLVLYQPILVISSHT